MAIDDYGPPNFVDQLSIITEEVALNGMTYVELLTVQYYVLVAV